MIKRCVFSGGPCAVLIVVFFHVLFASLEAEQSRGPTSLTSIAITDFFPAGETDRQTIDELNKIVRLIVMNSGQFQVMGRETMIRLLEDAKFEQTFLCTRPDCLMQMGSTLDVPYLLVGSVNANSDQYNLSVRIVNGETGEDDVSSSVSWTKGQRELEMVAGEAFAELFSRFLQRHATPTATNTPMLTQTIVSIAKLPTATPTVVPPRPYYKRWYTWGLGVLAAGGIYLAANPGGGESKATSTPTHTPTGTETPTVTPTFTPSTQPTVTPTMGCNNQTFEAWISNPSTETGFYMNCFEWPNFFNYFPDTSVTWFDARTKCYNDQKRLCRVEEWQLACSGQKGFNYPYGEIYDPSKCCTERDGLCRAGANNGCISAFGIYDLSGNASEWVADEVPNRPDFYYKLGGDYRDGSACGCFDMQESYGAISDSWTGFRCCRDPESTEKASKIKARKKRIFTIVDLSPPVRMPRRTIKPPREDGRRTERSDNVPGSSPER